MAIKKQKNNISDISETIHPEAAGNEEAMEKAEEIDESLSEIYQDEDGNMVDVKKIDVKKKRGFFFWLLTIVSIILIIAGTLWFYYYRINNSITGDNIVLTINADKADVIAGQEYNYTIDYKNQERVEIGNIQIKVSLPENFILSDSQPVPFISSSTQNNIWKIDRLVPFGSGQIKIKGRLIGKRGDKGTISAEMSYVPKNFSSEFKKTSILETAVIDSGYNITVDNISTVLVGEENKITITIHPNEQSFLDKLKLVSGQGQGSGIEFIAASSTALFSSASSTSTSTLENVVERSTLKPNEWTINKLTNDDLIFKIPFKMISKTNPTEEMKLEFFYTYNDKDYLVFDNTISFEVVKSDLNLGLVINGARNDQGINLGDNLVYSITYSNKGESDMKDVVIMAVIEGDLTDWNTLKDNNKGKIKDNMIIWSKEEIPGLADLSSGAEGTIDFSLRVLGQDKLTAGKKEYSIKNYAQFSIGNRNEIKQGGDSQSNTILIKINSDLNLNEALRYFNDDNIAVGSGPFPPKVGEATTFRVYWKIANNLHEINNLKVESILPPYVNWNDSGTSTIGTVSYNKDEHKVVWEIGRLPVILSGITAEFSIGITPLESDRNKILVLLPGSSITATDSETNSVINKTTKAKTTKLEDDDIANSDGRIQ